MNSVFTASIIFACLFGAVLLGRGLRRLLPEHHLSADTKDAVKLAMGLVATMAALLLGLLVSSAKGSYDTIRGEVIQMSAKAVFLDRVLVTYGPEATEARARYRNLVGDIIQRLWPEEANQPADLTPNAQTGNAVYLALQHLSPQDDSQRNLKAQAMSLAAELGQLRSLLDAQSVASISMPMLVVVIFWLFVIFLSFSVLAPPNATATLALLVSTLSVAGAIFLILELDHPFGGLIRISSQPMLNALSQFAN
jgi:hypothetical protein